MVDLTESALEGYRLNIKHSSKIGSFQLMLIFFIFEKCLIDSTFRQMHVWKTTVMMIDDCHNYSFWYQIHESFLWHILIWYEIAFLFDIQLKGIEDFSNRPIMQPQETMNILNLKNLTLWEVWTKINFQSNKKIKNL